jgi:hypothetical protein
MPEPDRRLAESLERLTGHLHKLQASNARLRARLTERPPHELYALAARLDAQARRARSEVGERHAARWEALADAIVAS